jgi:pilus assembly protein Flp/PilA
MKGFLRYFIRDKRGVSALEYGLIAAAIAVAIAATVGGVGNKIKNTFTNISNVS